MYPLILIPVDGSEASRAALQEALELAREQRARVRLIYVCEPIRHVVFEGVARRANVPLLLVRSR